MKKKHVNQKSILALLLSTLMLVTAMAPVVSLAADPINYVQEFPVDKELTSSTTYYVNNIPSMYYSVQSASGAASYAIENNVLKLTNAGLPNTTSTVPRLDLMMKYQTYTTAEKVAIEFDFAMDSLPEGITSALSSKTNYFINVYDSSGAELARLTLKNGNILLGDANSACIESNGETVDAVVATNVIGTANTMGTDNVNTIKILLDFTTDTYTAFCNGVQAHYNDGGESIPASKNMINADKVDFYFIRFCPSYQTASGETSEAPYNTYVDNWKVTELIDPTYTTSVTDGQVGVYRNENITINFSKAMDEATLANITFKNAKTGTEVDANRTVVNGGKSYILAPKANLDERTRYTLSVPATVKDTSGLAVEADEISFYTEAAEYADEYHLNFTGDNQAITKGSTITFNTDVYMGLKTNTASPTAYSIENNTLKLTTNKLPAAGETHACFSLNHRRNEIYDAGTVETSFTLKMDAFPEGVSELKNDYFIILRESETNSHNGEYIGRLYLRNNRIYLGAPNSACVESGTTNVDAILATNVAGRTEPMEIVIRMDFDNQTFTAYCDGQQARYCASNTEDADLPDAYLGTATKAFEKTTAMNFVSLYLYNSFLATGSNENPDYNVYVDDWKVKERKVPAAAELTSGTENVLSFKPLTINLGSAFSSVSGIELQDVNGDPITGAEGALDGDGYTYTITHPVLEKSTTYKIHIPEQTDVFGNKLAESTITFITAATNGALVVSDYRITKGENEPVDGLNAGETINVSATFSLTGGTDSSDAAMIIGVYNATDSLLKVFYDASGSKLTPASPSETLDVSFTVPEGASYIRMFAWDSLTKLVPMEAPEKFPKDN